MRMLKDWWPLIQALFGLGLMISAFWHYMVVEDVAEAAWQMALAAMIYANFGDKS